MGRLHDSVGRHEEALACFDRAVEVDADAADAWFQKGNSLALLRRFDELAYQSSADDGYFLYVVSIHAFCPIIRSQEKQ